MYIIKKNVWHQLITSEVPYIQFVNQYVSSIEIFPCKDINLKIFKGCHDVIPVVLTLGGPPDSDGC